MTETDQLSPDYAITLLVGAFFCWQRDEPMYPDASFGDYLERVWEPRLGWSPERILLAISEAERVMSSDDPQKNRAVLDSCFRAIGLGALLLDRELVHGFPPNRERGTIP